MNYPQEAAGIEGQSVAPECFYRGSRSGFAWIPA